jgi:hypothetical protein
MTAILKVDTIQDTSGNNIINESSDTITIGASGDTISIPSGATITNSGTATGFGGGKVLQIVQGSTSTETRNNTNTLADTTLTAAITPSASDSKVLVTVFQNGCDKSAANAGNQMILKLLRGSSVISTFGNNVTYTNSAVVNSIGTVGTMYLDSPSTTSATTYKTQFSSGDNSAGVGVQGTGGEVSTITLMEISA